MSMAIPLAGFDVQLDVSRHRLAVDGEDGILKITSAEAVSPARVNYFQLLTHVGNQFDCQPMLPDTGNKLFSDLCLHVVTRLRVGMRKKFTGLILTVSVSLSTLTWGTSLRLFILCGWLVLEAGTLSDQSK
jgi:hypothetical protein